MFTYVSYLPAGSPAEGMVGKCGSKNVDPRHYQIKT